MKVATAAYPLDQHADWSAYSAKVNHWVAEAKANGADLAVFPEYALMEVATLTPNALGLQQQAEAVADRYDDIERLFCDLARAHDLYILLGSGPARAGRILVNRSSLVSPSGGAVRQDKMIMTRFERDPWGISGGGPLRIIDTPIARFGILTCYDGEFPLLGRTLVENDVEVILVPSCTEALSGYWRVRIGAMSRALEGQCVTVMSSVVGDAAWCEAVAKNTGAGGVFCPPDNGFPSTGVLAIGGMNEPGWVYADVDIENIRHVRADGHVLNRLHWSEQSEALKTVETCRLV